MGLAAIGQTLFHTQYLNRIGKSPGNLNIYVKKYGVASNVVKEFSFK